MTNVKWCTVSMSGEKVTWEAKVWYSDPRKKLSNYPYSWLFYQTGKLEN